MDTEYTSKLAEIINARKTVYKLSPLLLAHISGGLVFNHFAPGIGALFGIAAFFVIYKRLVVVAHMPCPKCGQPFGTASRIPFGVGTNHCENCGLSLYEDQV